MRDIVILFVITLFAASIVGCRTDDDDDTPSEGCQRCYDWYMECAQECSAQDNECYEADEVPDTQCLEEGRACSEECDEDHRLCQAAEGGC